MPSFVQVQLSQVRDPVHKEYQQQSSVFNRFLSWLPWEQRKCNLTVQIEHEEYPPCIHMDLLYDDPSMRQGVNTTLKIYTTLKISDSWRSNSLYFRVHIPGEELTGQWVCLC